MDDRNVFGSHPDSQLPDDNQMAMNWVDRVAPYKVGDIVQFSAARAKGKSTGLNVTKDYTIATIEWDTPDMPEKVNTRNLEKVRGISR